MSKPTTSCLITHYNCGRYIEEAIQGALAQQVPFDEIVLVDDGSDDGSLETVRNAARRESRIRLVEKSNAGQLSAFHAGFELCGGEIVFFLDSDDVFEPGYTHEVLQAYAEKPARDFVFCGRRLFGREDRVELNRGGDRDLGYSVIYTLVRRRWIGAPTSCLSMRRSVLERLLPLPNEADWRTRADDCLVLGASVVGARKHYLGRPLVRYRVHEGNAYYGVAADPAVDYRRKLAIARLLAHLARRTGHEPAALSEFAHRELRTVERPTSRELRDYLGIALHAPVPWGRRLGVAGDILLYGLFQSRLSGRDATADAEAQKAGVRP